MTSHAPHLHAHTYTPIFTLLAKLMKPNLCEVKFIKKLKENLMLIHTYMHASLSLDKYVH